MNTSTVAPRNHVLAFVALHHNQQKRKYTGEPYLSHLQTVAKMADGKCKFGYEIGLCHDLLEDTLCDETELQSSLERFGYSQNEAFFIVNRVIELTDVFTPENSPELNRKARKTLESLRLHSISKEAQTVKYCDIINNSESILKHDPGFAKKYIPELQSVLNGMDQGNKVLYKKALNSLTTRTLTV